MTSNDRATVLFLADKSRMAAAAGIASLNLGEKLVASLVLNRADWLTELGYTIPAALDQIGPQWAHLVPATARLLRSHT